MPLCSPGCWEKYLDTDVISAAKVAASLKRRGIFDGTQVYLDEETQMPIPLLCEFGRYLSTALLDETTPRVGGRQNRVVRVRGHLSSASTVPFEGGSPDEQSTWWANTSATATATAAGVLVTLRGVVLAGVGVFGMLWMVSWMADAKPGENRWAFGIVATVACVIPIVIGGTLFFCGPAPRGEADWAGIAGGLLSLVGALGGVYIGTGVADTGLPRDEWWSRMAGYLAVFGVCVVTIVLIKHKATQRFLR